MLQPASHNSRVREHQFHSSLEPVRVLAHLSKEDAKPNRERKRLHDRQRRDNPSGQALPRRLRARPCLRAWGIAGQCREQLRAASSDRVDRDRGSQCARKIKVKVEVAARIHLVQQDRVPPVVKADLVVRAELLGNGRARRR